MSTPKQQTSNGPSTLDELARRTKILTGWVVALGVLLLAALGGVGWMINEHLQPKTAPLSQNEAARMIDGAVDSLDVGDALTESDVQRIAREAVDTGDALTDLDVKRIVRTYCNVYIPNYSSYANLSC